MATYWNDNEIKCPFYSSQGGLKIYCEVPKEAFVPAKTVSIKFQSPKSREDWAEDFCADNACHKTCAIYQAIYSMLN